MLQFQHILKLSEYQISCSSKNTVPTNRDKHYSNCSTLTTKA